MNPIKCKATSATTVAEAAGEGEGVEPDASDPLAVELAAIDALLARSDAALAEALGAWEGGRGTRWSTISTGTRTPALRMARRAPTNRCTAADAAGDRGARCLE